MNAVASNDKGHIVPNGSDDVKRPMMMTDYVQLFCFCIVLTTDEIVRLANFVEQHLVPYEYAGISLVVIEASKWLGILLHDGDK